MISSDIFAKKTNAFCRLQRFPATSKITEDSVRCIRVQKPHSVSKLLNNFPIRKNKGFDRNIFGIMILFAQSFALVLLAAVRLNELAVVCSWGSHGFY